MAPPALPLLWRCYQVSRRGLAPEECQDAAAADAARRRFAVADGASESSHSGLWARLLVEDFVVGGVGGDVWAAGLPPLQRRWSEEVGPRPGDPPLPWYVEERLRAGAFATFLGVVLGPGEEGSAPWRWQALAVGDSCLFQVRDGGLVEAFPIKFAAEFGSTPWLVGSRTSPRGLDRASGPAHPGDRLWLMTDALAHWFLRLTEAGARPWEELQRLTDDDSDQRFARWVEALRAAHLLRDDDVTLLAILL
jgi:hypothetical protein